MSADAQTGQECRETARGLKLRNLRPYVQSAWLFVWLAPLGRWLHGFPSCVFHCYACPLSSLACPVGLAANYASGFPVWQVIPWLLVGVLVAVGAFVGSLVCGWACPFGFLQDLLGRLRRHQWQIPAWLGHVRYGVLVGMVMLLPMYFGSKGLLYDDHPISICRLCPAGALEAGLYYSSASLLAGKGWIMSWYKSVILVAFVLAAVLIHRPWCRVLCPLGGFLSLFNRFSLFHLRFKSNACIECNLCRTRCPAGVKVDEKVNVTNCTRCLECTSCGAIEPALALPGMKRAGEDLSPSTSSG